MTTDQLWCAPPVGTRSSSCPSAGTAGQARDTTTAPAAPVACSPAHHYQPCSRGRRQRLRRSENHLASGCPERRPADPHATCAHMGQGAWTPTRKQRSLIPRGLWRARSMPHFRFHQGKRDKQGQRRMVAVRDRGPRAAQGKPTAGQGAAGRPVGPQVAQRQQNQKKRTVCLSHWPLPRAVQDTTPRAPGCPPPSTGSPSSGLRAWWLWV